MQLDFKINLFCDNLPRPPLCVDSSAVLSSPNYSFPELKPKIVSSRQSKPCQTLSTVLLSTWRHVNWTCAAVVLFYVTALWSEPDRYVLCEVDWDTDSSWDDLEKLIVWRELWDLMGLISCTAVILTHSHTVVRSLLSLILADVEACKDSHLLKVHYFRKV